MDADFCKDFGISLELVSSSRRLDEIGGVRFVWLAIYARGLKLPTKGQFADNLWTQCLKVGFEDPNVMKQIFAYARKQKDEYGSFWSKLYLTVLSNYLPARHGEAWLLHIRLQKYFPPTSLQFRQLFEFALCNDKSRKTYLRMHECFPHVRIYDSAISELCRRGLHATAAEWHETLIRRGDFPSDARKAEPVLRFFSAHGSEKRLMESIRLMVEAGVSFAVYRKKNAKIPSYISRDIVVPPLGIVEEVPEKKLSDGFCARMFATQLFSINTIISTLAFLGVDEIGPQALREMTSRRLDDFPFDRAVQECLNQLEEVGISTGTSTFSVVVQKLAAEKKDYLLRNVITCDLHSDTFEDRDLQEKLLAQYHQQHDRTAFARTICILTARTPRQSLETKRMNLTLRAHLTSRDSPGVMRIVDSMQEQGFQVSPKSMIHMRDTMLSHRKPGRAPVTTKELDLLTRLWQDALRSRRFIPPYAWSELLRRLGMSGRLLTFERLALWLAAWYSSPEFRASRLFPTFANPPRPLLSHPLMSVDLRPGNPLHPLQTLFPVALQKGIVAWGFQHTPYLGPRRRQVLDWSWGLALLRKLRDRGVFIQDSTISRALRRRLVYLSDNAQSKRRINLVKRRESLSIHQVSRKARKIWGGSLDLDHVNNGDD
ncbi:MAG: hypothetical protein Q9219_004741 [cf. Caloplaca sp. 3 TL-2023]